MGSAREKKAFPLTVLLIGVGLVIAVILVVCAGYVIHDYDDAIKDAYAADVVSALITRYIESHEGAFPRSWDELRGPHSEFSQRDSSWSLEELKRRVGVKWINGEGAKDNDVRGQSDEFVWLRSGRRGFLTSPNPNQRISEELDKWHK